MSGTAPTYNGQSQDPELKDVLDLYKRDAMLSTNCHALGQVVSFNPNDTALKPSRPTAVVQIAYPKTVFYHDEHGIFTPQTIPYSTLVSVPVVIMSGGGGQSGYGATLTFPVTSGDLCIVMFNDRSLDNWKDGIVSQTVSVSSSRVHDLSDGFALIGLPILPKISGSTPAYDPQRAVLQFGDAQVGVHGASNKVLITNDPNKVNNLGPLIAQLINLITTGLIAGAYTVGPIPGATTDQWNALTRALQNLLE